MIPRRASCGIALGAVSLALLAGCGGGKHATDPAAQIKQNWVTFFDGSTPTAERVKLLENGQTFAKLLGQIGANPLAKQLKAQVAKVELDGSSKATVTYTILLAGTPALQNTKGAAVLQNGTWKVGTASFCALLKLEGAQPAACSSG